MNTQTQKHDHIKAKDMSIFLRNTGRLVTMHVCVAAVGLTIALQTQLSVIGA